MNKYKQASTYLIMREIQPELGRERKESGALENLPGGRGHLEERIDGDDCVRGEKEAKGEEVERGN